LGALALEDVAAIDAVDMATDDASNLIYGLAPVRPGQVGVANHNLAVAIHKSGLRRVAFKQVLAMDPLPLRKMDLSLLRLT
jgi:hypothetical protein